MSAAELDRKLAAKGYSKDERDDALGKARRAGLIDDARYASGRAESLAARGAGDALIRHDLERAGVAREAAEAAVAQLEPERTRARRIVESRGDGPKTRRYLAAKGFSDDAVEDARESSAGGTGDCW